MPRMTANYPLHYRPTDAELASKRKQNFSLYPSLADLVCLFACQLRIRSALLVDELRNRLQVHRVYARRVSTQMVEFVAVRNLADESFVEVPRRLHDSPTIAVPNASVSLRGTGALPNPAGCLVAAVLNLVSRLKRFRWAVSAVVSADEASMLSSRYPLGEVRALRYWGWLSASALTDAGRIRWRRGFSNAAELVVEGIWARVAFAVSALRSGVNACRLAAPTRAQIGHTSITTRTALEAARL